MVQLKRAVSQLKGGGGGPGSLKEQLIRGGIGSIAIKVAALLLGMAVAVLLARILGPEEYGVYVYAYTIVSILALLAQFGLPSLVLRETAKAQVEQRWGLMDGLWRWSISVAGMLSLGLVAIAWGVAWLTRDNLSELQYLTFILALLLVPSLALGNVRSAALRGLRRVVIGQLPDTTIRPMLFILLILVSVVALPGGIFDAKWAMGLHTLAGLAALMAGALLLKSVQPTALSGKEHPEFRKKEWCRAALPMVLLSGMNLLNQYTDILMLGVFESAEDVGVYRISVTVAGLIVFGLQAVNMVLAPHVTRLYHERNQAQLQHLVTKSARIVFALALPAFIFFILYGHEALKLVFGEDYSRAYWPLVILGAGQLVNALMGSVVLILNMTGFERDATFGVGVSVISNVFLNLILIPLYGIVGAASATAVSIIIWNLVLSRKVKLNLGLSSGVVKI